MRPLDGGGAVIQKVSIRVELGDLSVMPPHAAGDVALVRVMERALPQDLWASVLGPILGDALRQRRGNCT